MKVILYIGHHKVGSTALQAFLSRNWLRLARAGILYPSVESRGFANNLRRGLRGQDSEARAANVREPHSALAYRMIADVSARPIPPQFHALPATAQMVRALRNQADLVEPATVVLCSEAFANFGDVDPGLVSRLKDIFPEAGLTVYCALRRPDSYLVSWHGQRLKAGEKLKTLQNGGALQYAGGIHFDYRKAVQAWHDNLPGARLILRSYDEVLAAGGSVEDFLVQTGLDVPADLAPATRANPSLPRAAFEIIRRANHALEPQEARTLCRHFLALPAGASPVRNADVEMFGARQRKVLAARFAPVQASLGRLAGRDGFFAGIDEMSLPLPVPERDATAQLLAGLDPATLPGAAHSRFIAGLKKTF